MHSIWIPAIGGHFSTKPSCAVPVNKCSMMAGEWSVAQRIFGLYKQFAPQTRLV
jgi:hypothetical protein